MVVSTRLEPIERDILVMIDRDLSPAAQAQSLAEFAQSAIAEATATNTTALGYTPDHSLRIDGAEAGDFGAVRPNSTISALFHLLTDVIGWVDEQLILHSPVRSERYARSHILLADGVEADITDPPAAESYVILNAQPYARKIEKGLSSQAPDGVYEAVATLANRRFGNIAHVSFTFRSLQGGAVGTWARTPSAQALAREIRRGNSRYHEDWLTRQPAIYIDPGA